MSKPIVAVLLTTFTALSSALIAVPAAAQPAGAPAPAEAPAAEPSEEAKKEASERFRRGVDFYQDGDYAAALVEFQRAYEVAPNYRLLYNLGQTSFELKDYPMALQSFQQYLEEGGEQISRARRIKVENEITKLRNYVARITLKLEPGAEIVVDDKLVGISPLPEPIVVSAGRRKISVTKEGFAPLQRYVDVAGGEALELELTLSSLQANPNPNPNPTPTPTPQPIKPVGGAPGIGVWVGVGATVALGVAAGIVGGLALSASSDYDTALNTFPTTQGDIDDAASKVRTLAGATDGLIAATGVAAVVTIAVLAVDLSGGGEEEAATAPPQSGAAPRPQLRLQVGATGLGLSGTF